MHLTRPNQPCFPVALDTHSLGRQVMAALARAEAKAGCPRSGYKVITLVWGSHGSSEAGQDRELTGHQAREALA